MTHFLDKHAYISSAMSSLMVSLICDSTFYDSIFNVRTCTISIYIPIDHLVLTGLPSVTLFIADFIYLYFPKRNVFTYTLHTYLLTATDLNLVFQCVISYLLCEKTLVYTVHSTYLQYSLCMYANKLVNL